MLGSQLNNYNKKIAYTYLLDCCNQASESPVDDAKPTEDIAVARPVVPEIKPTEGAIPPPPPVKPKVSKLVNI